MSLLEEEEEVNLFSIIRRNFDWVESVIHA